MQANPINSPCKVFVIYSREDVEYLTDLLGHLEVLKTKKVLDVWCDMYIDPGQKWAKEIVDKLDEAEIILIFISKYYFNSKFIQETEIVRAAEKHKNGEAIAIPVYIRPYDWKEDNFIGSLQGLPPDTRPLSSYDKHQCDEIISTKIVKGIINAVEQVKKIRMRKHGEREREYNSKKQEEERGKETVAWENVLNSNSISSCSEYLSIFPTGIHAKEVKDLLKKLEEDKAQKEQDQFWSEAVAKNTLESYQVYMGRYPNGIYKDIAASRSGISQRGLGHKNGAQGFLKNRFALLGIGLLGVIIGLLASSLFSNSPKQAPKNDDSEWSLAKNKSTIYAYQKFIYNTPNEREARDSLAKLEQLRDKELADGIYYYRNGHKDWALESFLKVRSMDSLNTKALAYLDSLGYGQ